MWIILGSCLGLWQLQSLVVLCGSSQWSVSPGVSSLEGGVQNGTCQCCCQNSRIVLQKWLLPVSQSLETVPALSCLSGRHLEISKWMFIPCSLCTFLIWCSCLVEWVCMQAFWVGFPFLHFSNSSEHTPCWFSKPGVWGVHLSCGRYKVCDASWGSNLSLLRDDFQSFEIPSDCGVPHLECVFYLSETISLSLLCNSVLSLVVKSLLIYFLASLQWELFQM